MLNKQFTVIVPTSKQDVKEITKKGLAGCVLAGKTIINSKEVKCVQTIASTWFDRTRLYAAKQLEKAANKIIPVKQS